MEVDAGVVMFAAVVAKSNGKLNKSRARKDLSTFVAASSASRLATFLGIKAE
jgi:hypothetical protein